jgi:integrase
MPKPRRHELVQCRYFAWRVCPRSGVLHADGRSNKPNAGRFSLGSADRNEALKRLHELDAIVAADLGLAPRPAISSGIPLPLADGRRLYEEHIKRPREVGGVRSSTQKRYRTVFDKFLLFAKGKRIAAWNEVRNQTLNAYATHLRDQDYAGKTLRNELTTLVQAYNWLREEHHLTGVEPLHLSLTPTESQRPYCYTTGQVAAMVQHCQDNPSLAWLGGVIIALASTGFRISELASLRWSDVDLPNFRLQLTDESGRSRKQVKKRELKSGRSRKLTIHSEFATLLSGMSHNDSLIFHGPRGGRLKPNTVRRIFIAEVIEPLKERFPSAEDELGFKDGRLHSFRHYFASMCAMRGVPERVAMEWLGHKDSEMVRHYFHLHDAESRVQMERLDPIGNTGTRLAGAVNQAASDPHLQEQPSRGEPDYRGVTTA